MEKETVLSQVELGVTHIDDFENHTNSRFDYSLQNLQEHTQFNFYPASSPNKQDGEEAFGGHISGTTLNVNGVALDDDISARVLSDPQDGGENNDPVVTNVEILKEASPDGLGPQRVAVILAKTKGSTFTPYYSKEQIEEMIFRGDVQKFFKEASYGKMWLDEEKSKVFGWYEVEGLNINRRDNITNTTTNEIINITDADIDFAEFDRIMVGASIKEDTNNGWGNVGKRIVFTADGNVHLSFGFFGVGHSLLGIYAHESGHNLGVMHANLWDCDQGGVEGNCEHKEYGNRFDIMGPNTFNHFNGYFKEVFLWLNKPVINITSSGKYSLQPLESSEAVVAKISRPGASNFPIYYFEARAPVGFDDDTNDTNIITKNKISGIHINWVNKPLETRFLTLIPRGIGIDLPREMEALKLGQSFRDEKAGVSITNIDDTTVDIQIQDVSCKEYPFNVTVENISVYELWGNDHKAEKADLFCSVPLNPGFLPVNAECVLKRKKQGDLTLSFSLVVKNNNSYACPNVNINTFVDFSSNRYDKYPQTGSISSGKVSYISPGIVIPASTPAGLYSINAFVENRDTSQRIFSTSRDLKIVDEISILEGDLNNDGKVDIFDLVTVAKDFGKKGEGFSGDADKNGVVDIFDLVIVAKNFGKKI